MGGAHFIEAVWHIPFGFVIIGAGYFVEAILTYIEGTSEEQGHEKEIEAA